MEMRTGRDCRRAPSLLSDFASKPGGTGARTTVSNLIPTTWLDPPHALHGHRAAEDDGEVDEEEDEVGDETGRGSAMPTLSITAHRMPGESGRYCSPFANICSVGNASSIVSGMDMETGPWPWGGLVEPSAPGPE